MDGSSAELAGLEARFRRSAPSFEELGARAAAFAGSSRAPGPERAYRSDRRRSSFAAIHRSGDCRHCHDRIRWRLQDWHFETHRPLSARRYNAVEA